MTPVPQHQAEHPVDERDPHLRDNNADIPRRAWVEHHMGMPVSIHLRGRDVDGSRAGRAVAAAFDAVRELDEIFSTYRADSELMRLRREEVGIGDCSPLMTSALDIGEYAERITRGAFCTLLPTGDGDLAFDPTGLVKGWAVDLAAEHLADLSEVSWCINAGGDLLVGAGAGLPVSGPGSISWRVGIESPYDRTRVATTLELTQGAVATSGTAARGAHLYDPAREQMVSRAGSVTVTGPRLLWADVWATALFVGGHRTRDAFIVEAPHYGATAL